MVKFNFKLKPSDLNYNEISLPLLILAIVATSGFLAVVLVAPGVLQIMKMFKKKKSYYPSTINNCLNRLVKNGLIVKEGTKLKLSTKGELRLLKYQKGISQTKKKWDGKWRIVIFDIWEKNKKKRDFLRQELVGFGFIKLQNSVWITPYECEDYINLLKADIGLGKSVIYIVADKVDGEMKFKRIFDL